MRYYPYMYLDDLRRRLADKCDIAQALLALNRSLTPETLRMFYATRQLIATGLCSDLEHAEFMLDVNIQNAERHAGYKGGYDFLLKLGRDHRDGEIMEYSKLILDELLFDHYERVIPLWKKIQPHALIHIDLSGVDLDLSLPEASLYEDMCFSFNRGWETRKASSVNTKQEVKAHMFYTRACLISSYNFVESFLNGLAFDFLHTAQRTLDQSDVDFLTEWNSANNRQRFVKFRDKALQYPKIILKRKTPLFTESSCPSFATLMKNISRRDAVVHNDPKINLSGDDMPKIRGFVELRFEQLPPIVDAAVRFVKDLDTAVNQGRYDNEWIIPRTSAGPFPPESFV